MTEIGEKKKRFFIKESERFEDMPGIDTLKRQAKKLKKEIGVSHYEALNLIASNHGFLSWSFMIQVYNFKNGKEEF